MSLQGQTALITGGGKNLGAQVARELASDDAQLALHYNSPASRERLSVHVGDLTTSIAVGKLFHDAVAEYGKLDIVVNTVGMVLKKLIAEVSEAEYDEMFAVNSKAALLILKESAKTVQDGGKIVTIVTSLLAAFTGFYTSYPGTKAPVEHFTRGAAKELSARRISVNAIAPGPMDTPFFCPQDSDNAVTFHKSMAMDGRLTEVQDIAPTVKFLCISGQWTNG